MNWMSCYNIIYLQQIQSVSNSFVAYRNSKYTLWTFSKLVMRCCEKKEENYMRTKGTHVKVPNHHARCLSCLISFILASNLGVTALPYLLRNEFSPHADITLNYFFSSKLLNIYPCTSIESSFLINVLLQWIAAAINWQIIEIRNLPGCFVSSAVRCWLSGISHPVWSFLSIQSSPKPLTLQKVTVILCSLFPNWDNFIISDCLIFE